jgi:hypothetical protein
MTIQEINKQLSSKALAKARATKPEVGLPAAIAAAQQRVSVAKQQLASINKIVACVTGNGSAKLVVAVRDLNERLAELDKQLAALAKQVRQIFDSLSTQR